jgi:hypothetical protein
MDQSSQGVLWQCPTTIIYRREERVPLLWSARVTCESRLKVFPSCHKRLLKLRSYASMNFFEAVVSLRHPFA